jgi:hypothetical protein
MARERSGAAGHIREAIERGARQSGAKPLQLEVIFILWLPLGLRLDSPFSLSSTIQIISPAFPE